MRRVFAVPLLGVLLAGGQPSGQVNSTGHMAGRVLDDQSFLPLVNATRVFLDVISADVQSAAKPTVLKLEAETVLRVGELAVLQVPSDGDYSTPPDKTTPGDNTTPGGTLTVLRRSTRWSRIARSGPDLM